MRKIIVLLLVIVLGVGLFSCSQSQENDDVISIFRWDFAAINSARKKQTPLYKNIKEKIGADIEVVTCGYADWESVLNNRFNTSTLPDVFVNYAIDRPETFSKWIQNGSVLAISDYVSETEYPNIYNKLQQYTYLLDRIEYLDGKFYALPIDIKMTHGMFVRVDWINNLNKPEKLRTILTDELGRAPTDEEMESMKFTTPTTLLEFYRLAKAFSLYDPDENGRRDTYGYSSSNSLMWYNNWIFEAYDSTFFGMVEDGKGGLTSSWITQGNKNAVAFLNKLYNEGILDPDYIAVTDSQKIENFCQGRIGIMVDNIYYNNIIEQFKNANAVTREQAMEDVAVITPPAGENGSFGMRGNPGFWCGTSIRADVSAAKRNKILTMLDYLLSDEGREVFSYGIEGEHYEVVDGEKVSLMGVDNNGYNYTIQTEDSAFDLISLVDWSVSYNLPFATNYEKIQAILDNAASYSRVDPVMYVQTPLYIEKEQILGNDSIEVFVELIGKDYNDYKKDGMGTASWNSIMTSSTGFDSDWTSFVNKFNTTWGGAAMIEEYSKEAIKYLR